MRDRILFSDYSVELTDKGWRLRDQQGYKRVFARRAGSCRHRLPQCARRLVCHSCRDAVFCGLSYFP